VPTTQERPISSTSTWETVLDRIPSPPDELGHLLQAANGNSFANETLRALDEATKTQDYFKEEAPESTNTSLNPTSSRNSASAKSKISHPILPPNRGTAPPTSINQKTAISTTPSHSQSSNSCLNDISAVLLPHPDEPSLAQTTLSLQRCVLPPGNSECAAVNAPDTKDQKTEDSCPFRRITTVTKTCWISNVQVPPSEYITHWTEQLTGRIDTTLLQRLPPANENQSSLALSLCMIKTRQKELRPAVLVTCCGDNLKRGRAVKRILAELSKTGGFRGPEGVDLPYFVTVEGGFNF